MDIHCGYQLMMNTSIRREILVILLVAQGLLTAGCVTALVTYIDQQRTNVFDSEIQRRVSLLLPMVQVDDADSTRLRFTPRQESLSSDDLFDIRGLKGEIVGTSSHSVTIVHRTAGADAKGFTLNVYGRPYRARFFQAIPVFIDRDEEGKVDIPGPKINILYAISATTFNAITRRINIMAVLGSLFWITLSCLIAWYSVTRGMMPLGELAAQASKITERKWSFFLSPQMQRVSELRPLVGALEALVTRLGTAFERERTFFSDAAHELKTIVAIQKSSLQVTLQGPENVTKYRNGLERVSEDVDRLNVLVHRMLSLASIESSDHSNAEVSIALEETILAACDQLRPVATAHQITLDLQIATPCLVASEQYFLQTLWGTLIENAIRYSSPNSSIAVATVLQKGFCTVSVTDHGVGIAPEYLPHLFERFYRADPSRARDSGGFGLGLAIAKAIVDRHRGGIEIKSEPGRGTTVLVMLPCVDGRSVA
jgi:signal transduction histidine kinase